MGKRLAIMADAQLNRHNDDVVERLKMISGEDLITVNKKYADAYTTRLSTRLIILSNELPRLKDASGALANRMLVLPMTRTFTEKEDPTLEGRLKRELPGILVWAIAGWRRLQQRGRFVQPESGRLAQNELRDLSSPIGRFVREECRVDDPDAETPKMAVYDAYRRWCMTNGEVHPLSASDFGGLLKSVVPRLGTAHPTIAGKRTWCYKGIALKA